VDAPGSSPERLPLGDRAGRPEHDHDRARRGQGIGHRDLGIEAEYGLAIEDIPDERVVASARLVAAAPELLTAAKAVLALLTDDGTQGGPTWTIKALRDAIEWAEGERRRADSRARMSGHGTSRARAPYGETGED
jgi:hypothetical protein